MDRGRPGMGVPEQNIILSSLGMAQGRIHTVANMEGSMRGLEPMPTEAEGKGRRGRTGRGDSEAPLLEGPRELSSVVSLELANLGVLSA